MSIASHLIHRCDIERATETEDEYNENVQTWSAHLSDVPCRLVEKAEREGATDVAESPLVSTYLLLVPRGTDVEEDDRISAIRYQDGTEDDRVFDVEAKLVRRARATRHISLQLKRIR